MRPICHRLLCRGRRINAIAAITSSGVLAFEIISDTVNGDCFFYYLRGSLIPNMMSFPNPRSILILDNCAIHHVEEVKDLLAQSGIVAMFLPPYSPDLNPIEEAFSYVKAYLRKHDDVLQVIRNQTDVIESAFESITEDHCNSWIINSGYQWHCTNLV